MSSSGYVAFLVMYAPGFEKKEDCMDDTGDISHSAVDLVQQWVDRFFKTWHLHSP